MTLPDDDTPAAAPVGAPYAGLEPATVLDALAAVGLHGDGRLLQLNSYENRVFRIHLEDGGAVVAKFYRPRRWTDAQILEEHAYSAELAEAEVPVVAPVPLQPAPGGGPGRLQLVGTPATLAHWAPTGNDAGWRFAITPWHGGRAPDTDQIDVLERLGGFLGRLHAVGGRARFAHRLSIDTATLGDASLALLRDGGHLTPAEAPAFLAVAQAGLDVARAAFDGLPGTATRRLHGDCHLGNILWREDSGAHFVDMDDAANGPAVQDLWMLLPAGGDERRARLRALLEGYEAFVEFDDRELTLIEPLRTLRMLRHSAWIAERWADPAFPSAFPWFGTPAYWSQQTTQLREQLEAMQGG